MISLRERFIALVDNDSPRPSDAIVLLEGDGAARADESARLLQAGMAPRIVVSGGLDIPEKGCFPPDRLRQELLSRGVAPDRIVLESRSRHTREQAVEVMALAERLDWKALILVASNFHQYRAYLTFLKARGERGLDLEIHNAPARNLPWFEETGWGRRVDLLDSEFEKIETYQAMGHLASIQEGIDHIQWKERKTLS